MTTRWTDRADVAVVGLGMTGGPVLERLLDGSRAGRIAVLDRGEIWDPAAVSHPGEAELAGGSPLSVPAREDCVLFTDGTAPRPLAKWWSARRAGGGALLWYGQLSRFKPSDLRMGSLAGDLPDTELRDWPLEFGELAAGYRRIEERLRPYGSSYGHPYARYTALEGPNYRDRGVPSHFERTVIDRLQADGLQPYVGRSCLGGRAWDLHPVSPLTGRLPERPDLPLLHRPNWYARLYRRLHQDPRVRLTGGVYVVRVLVEHGTVRGVEFVERDRNGRPRVRRLRAGTVVLACGAMETVRILLTSGLPNANGLLGKRFTCTLERVAYLLTGEPRSAAAADRLAGLHATVAVKDFYDLGGDPVLRKGGKFALYDGLVAETPARHVRNLRLRGRALADFLAAEREHYVVKASFKGESIPSGGKYLTLSGRRNSYGAPVPLLHYRPHPVDLALQQRVPALVERLGTALGARHTLLHPAPAGPDLVSAHHHGGAVFGADPADSVLDPDCQCREARGLFVADSASMPTSGATNSSLTAMANADRVGAKLAAAL
ncbi:choline dehydrogenase-like flavoprotein [Kitasatospora sp. GP30]|uniref:GMC oxidoreductase n=1 Tax=Kitasatospora sp. GP30 TaxID=3035084 RepID=UPI000C7074B6|nr:GMC oxidoreductase [Kitasatospora sp. GP30]MDH6139339.1 choline dehydrogenase-like flavoprotein [Kitasatospora sp. GP30]